MEHRPLRISDDPFIKHRFQYAWRAKDAISNSTNTKTLKSYLGNAKLVMDATGQGIRRCSAILPGRFVIPFDGNNASRGFTGVLLSSPPAGFTFVAVAYISQNTSGTHALTAAGAPNTGNSAGYDIVTTFSQKVLSAVTKAQAQPAKFVIASVFDAAGTRHYSNSLTAVTGASAGALAGTSLTIGALDSAGTYTLAGELEHAGAALRALSDSEIGMVISTLARVHRITLS